MIAGLCIDLDAASMLPEAFRLLSVTGTGGTGSPSIAAQAVASRLNGGSPMRSQSPKRSSPSPSRVNPNPNPNPNWRSQSPKRSSPSPSRVGPKRGFDPRLCHADLLLSNENLTIKMTSTPKWATAMGPRLVDKGQHFWFVRLDGSSNIMIGLAVDSCMLVDTHEEQRAWFFYCHTGYKYHAGQGGPYGGKCEQGGVSDVLCD